MSTWWWWKKRFSIFGSLWAREWPNVLFVFYVILCFSKKFPLFYFNVTARVLCVFVFLCICLLLLCSHCWFYRLCVFCVFVFFSSFLSKVFFFKICPLKGLLLAPLGALYLICTQRSVRICPILAPRCYIRLWHGIYPCLFQTKLCCCCNMRSPALHPYHYTANRRGSF